MLVLRCRDMELRLANAGLSRDFGFCEQMVAKVRFSLREGLPCGSGVSSEKRGIRSIIASTPNRIRVLTYER